MPAKNLPGTLVLIGKGLVLGGSPSKIEVICNTPPQKNCNLLHLQNFGTFKQPGSSWKKYSGGGVIGLNDEFWYSKYTPPKFNSEFSPEKFPKPNRSIGKDRLPTTIFQGLCGYVKLR